MEINLIVTCKISCITIGYKYNSETVLGSISTEGDRSTDPGDTYISFPRKFYNVYIFTVLCTTIIGRYFNACNEIENHNMMRQYYL